MSSNVKELIEQGLVRESELGVSQGGRKPTMLLINHKAFYVIGVDVGPEKIECILSDLSGTITERNSIQLTTPITNEQFLTTLKESIHHVIQATTIKVEKMIGIGVAMHGVVDVETGISLFAPNLSLVNVPIKEELEKEFELEVKVENDARAMALGESWFGDHGELTSMLALNLGRGVGAGLVIDGKLYHGAQDIAGEVGHMTIDLHGETCECGNRGCLQTFATGSAIVKQAEKFMNEKNPPLTGERVYELALEGNEDCIRILQELGETIGVGLTNLIHIINPEKIVLGGGVTKSEKFIMPTIRKAVDKRSLTLDAKQTAIEVSKFGDDATIIGAVALLLEDIFAPN